VRAGGGWSCVRGEGWAADRLPLLKMSGAIAVHGTDGSEPAEATARPSVKRTTARPVSAVQRRPPMADDRNRERAWIGSSAPRPTSAGVQRGRIRPHSALARASGLQSAATSSEDDADDSYSVASTRLGKPSRAGSPNTYKASRASSPATYSSGYNSRPLSAMSRPVSAMSRASDVDSVIQEDDEGLEPTVTRCYYTRDLTAKDGTKMSHFSVKIPASELAAMGSSEGRTEHLRIYYSDLMGAEPAQDPRAKPTDRTIEVEKMANWLTDAVPRSRVDAYPLWVLTRDILKRFVGKDLAIASREAKRMASSLDLTNKALKKVQHDLGKSQKGVADRDEKLQKMQELVDTVPGLEEKQRAIEQKYAESEAKVSMLHKKIEEQKELFSKKLEETKASVKEKCDAANEKKLEAFKSQLSDMQKRLESSSHELAAARKAVVEAERQVKKQRDEFDSQLKLEKERALELADVLKALETMHGEDSSEVFKAVLTKHKPGCASTEGSLLSHLHTAHKAEKPEIHELPEGEESAAHTKTPLLRLMAKHRLYQNGEFDRIAYKNMDDSERWDLFLAFMSEHVHDDDDVVRPMNPLDALLIPAVNMAVGHEPVMSLAGVERAEQDPQIQRDLDAARKAIDELTQANDQLKQKIHSLEGELEEARKPPPEPVVEEVQPVEEAPKEKPKPKVEDWTKVKRPRALSVFKVDPKAFKGKTPSAARVDQMLSWFANIYEGKATADQVDDREGNTRQSLPEFMRDWMINKFGLKSIALSNLASLIMGIQAKKDEKDAGIRIRTFGLLSGIIPHDCWHEDLSNMILEAMGLMFNVSKISENLGHGATKKPLIDASLTIEATKQAWEKYGFGPVPSQLNDTMVQMARREGGQVRLHEWLELLCTGWLAAAERMEKDLREIFVQHDSNGDGVLDLDEFRGLINALLSGNETVDDRQISRLFAEALEESSAMKVGDDEDEDDVMMPEAFVRVARRARLYNPAS